MGNPITRARPYAKAVFAQACEQESVQDWFKILNKLSAIVLDKQVLEVVKNPLIKQKIKADIVLKLLGGCGENEVASFLFILAEKQRLILLPEIFRLFQEYKNNHENKKEVMVITAYPLDDEYKEKLITALEKRFKAIVHLKIKKDPAIIGGAIIQTDDTVIDGSVRGQLNELKEQLLA